MILLCYKKYSATKLTISRQTQPADQNLQKIWVRLPYLGTQGTNMINGCIRKLRKCLTKPVQFVIIFDTKKIAFYTSKKDKIPLLSRFNTIYQVTCSGCSKSYIGKTERCLKTRLNEHATQHDTSAIGQHFLQCQNHRITMRPEGYLESEPLKFVSARISHYAYWPPFS